MPELNLQATISRKPNMLSAGIDDELVLMDMQSAKYFGLDPVGSRIWDALAEPITVEDLCRRMGEAYQGDLATIQADVLAFVRQLAARGMIVVHD